MFSVHYTKETMFLLVKQIVSLKKMVRQMLHNQTNLTVFHLQEIRRNMDVD